jgi:hypothetical protein
VADDAYDALVPPLSLPQHFHVGDGNIAVRLIIQGAHDQAVAQQAAAAVDLLGGKPYPSQRGLPRICPATAKREGDIDDRVSGS